MREVILTVPAERVEDVLDRLVAVLPEGVHQHEHGSVVELRLRGEGVGTPRELKELLRGLPWTLREDDASEDWRERRIADYVPQSLGGRLVVRPAWAPPSGAEIEIVVGESSAFGSGVHPTTRACLRLMLAPGFPASGTFVDVGCGSGLLAILAARLGFDEVRAYDIRAEAVSTTRANAAANGLEISAELADVTRDPVPGGDVVAANVPAALHGAVAGLSPEPSVALVSGFGPGDASGAISAYTARGMALRSRRDVTGWTVAVLARERSA